jgi:hypothetical protein
VTPQVTRYCCATAASGYHLSTANKEDSARQYASARKQRHGEAHRSGGDFLREV